MAVLAIDTPRRREVECVCLRLPMPPSVNGLWKPHGGRFSTSPRYKAWKHDAGWALAQQRPGRVSGPYHFVLLVNRGKTKADLSNLAKAVEDLLVTFDVIDDDRNAESLILRWGSTEAGVVVTVQAVE